MNRVMHFEIHCDDVDRAERFYTGIFGWTVERYGGPVDYRLLATRPDGEPGINGALLQRRGPAPEEGAAVNAYVCTTAVEDLAALEAAIPAAGGTLAHERTTIPGIGDLAYFKDTEGNIFGVLQPAA